MTAQLDPPLLPPVVRPGARFLLAHPAHMIALGFGAGLSPLAPGTAGTLWGWASWLVLQHWLGAFGQGIVIAVSLVVGWWACTVTARDMRVLDPSSIVWDEVVTFWIVLWLVTPAGWDMQLAAFLIFRLLDALKPGPIGWADGLFHSFGWRGGLGILFDDLMAGFCTLLVIAAWRVL